MISTQVGYTGGTSLDPTYEQVCSGTTGHAEAVVVMFDPQKIGYRKLLDVFWHNIDPTVRDQQFCDEGTQYRTTIFYQGPEQKNDAEESLAKLNKIKPFKEPIVTEIVSAKTFYPPRSIINSTAVRTSSLTACIATTAGVTSGCASCGATQPVHR